MGARRSGKRSDRMGSQGSDAPGTLKGTLREMRQGTWLKNAQHRSTRRKSAWNLLLLLIFPLWLLLWWALVQAGYMTHFVFHSGTVPWGSNWMQHMIGSITLPQALLIFAPMVPALSGSMVIGNFLIYLIPPARLAMDAEDRDYPCTDYATAQKAFSKLTLYTAPVAVVLVLAGAWFLQ
jgi:hypothetical protein